MSPRTGSRPTTVLFPALLTAAIFCVAAAESAVPGCVSSATECTCLEHPPSGICTRPTVNGKCLDGECTEAMRCDCMGYEMCAINTCGKWDAMPPAVRSLTTEFQCTYDQNGSPCMSPTAFVETAQGSENAKTESVSSVDESIGDERECAMEITTCVGYQTESLEAIRKVREEPATDNHEVTDEEIEEVKAEVDETVKAVKEVSEAFNEVIEQTAVAVECEAQSAAKNKKAKRKDRDAKKLEKQEKAAAKEAEDKAEPCPTCDDLKAQIKAIRTEEREAAIAAGTWAKKARDAKKKSKNAKKNANEKKLSAEEAKERCIEKSNKILAKLQGGA